VVSHHQIDGRPLASQGTAGTLRLIGRTPTSSSRPRILAAKRRLRRMQPFPSRERQASLFGDSNEIAKVSPLHGALHMATLAPSAAERRAAHMYSRGENRPLSRVIRFNGCLYLPGHLNWAVAHSPGGQVSPVAGEYWSHWAASPLGLSASTAEEASSRVAKRFERAPVRATARPEQSIFPCFGAQTSPAPGNSVPLSCNYSRP
jgi:hypothetical protein